MVTHTLDDTAELVIIHGKTRGDPHLTGQRGVLHEHIGLPGNQPVEPVRVHIAADDIIGKGLVMGFECRDCILVHVLDDDKHPLDGIVKGHLRGIEQVFYRDDRLGLLHHFLADRHLCIVPYNRPDKWCEPLLCRDPDHVKAGYVGTDQHTEKKCRIGNNTTVDLLCPLERLFGYFLRYEKRPVRLYHKPDRIVLFYFLSFRPSLGKCHHKGCPPGHLDPAYLHFSTRLQ